MPELPEVETIARGLHSTIRDKPIESLLLRREGLRYPFPQQLTPLTVGAQIQQVSPRAKYLLFHLNNAHTILIHLGMSGRMVIHPHKVNYLDSHDHVIFTFDDTSQLIFNDPRRFGSVDIIETKTLYTHPSLASLGLEPLDDAFDDSILYQMTRGSRTPIKQWLMDAKKIVGIGNIYACEALFRSRIHPQRQAQTLRNPESERLTNCIKQVLSDAIAAGGSSLKDYKQSTGELGYFQHQFDVYGRAKSPCKICYTSIEQIKQSGRSTFFCSSCQR